MNLHSGCFAYPPESILCFGVYNSIMRFTHNILSNKVIRGAGVICSFVICVAAFAQPTRIPHGTLDLISENSSVAPGHDFTVGLQFKMDKGWHIYWVNPGDSGEPPHLTWQLPRGLKAGEIIWPAPRRMGPSTIINYVYDGDVLLMVPIRAGVDYSPSPSDKLEASVRFLICSDQMCVPGRAQLSLALPAKSQTNSEAVAASFAAARTHLPKAPPDNWKISGHAEKDSFVIDIQAGHAIPEGTFFPLHESEVDNAALQGVSARPTGMRLTLRKSGELTKSLANLKGVLELSDGQSYLIDVPIAPAARR
jgi:thiol:disulfide interchange protein DsbD